MKILIERVFKQFSIIRRAFVHPEVPWHAKVVAGAAVLYVVSPIQIIPNFIPIVGQTDDVLVVTLGIKYLKRFVPQSVLDECEGDARIPRKSKMNLVPVTVPVPSTLNLRQPLSIGRWMSDRWTTCLIWQLKP